MSTCNRLELQALGSQPVMLKNLPITESTTLILHCGHDILALCVRSFVCSRGP